MTVCTFVCVFPSFTFTSSTSVKLPTEPSAAVPVLPSSGTNCNVSTQQQWPVPGILQKPTERLPAQRSVCVPVHRWSHALPLHQGKKKKSTRNCVFRSSFSDSKSLFAQLIQYLLFWFISVVWIKLICYLCILWGTTDGGVRHSSSAVEVQHLWCVWNSQEQCAAEWVFSPGVVTSFIWKKTT